MYLLYMVYMYILLYRYIFGEEKLFLYNSLLKVENHEFISFLAIYLYLSFGCLKNEDDFN